jgi:hypothetical protein
VLLADAENVLTYIDDVLVHSRSHEEHLKHLSAAIDKIGTANLRLNPKKCVFGSDSVEYLGHTLSGDGVRPGQDKAKAMQTAQPPRSVKELRSFCGLANYFRSYIVQFAINNVPRVTGYVPIRHRCTSINLEKLAGAPIRPCGHVFQWYWPFPGMVKAVNGRSEGCSSSCQKALLQSSAEYTLLPALPTVSRHSSMVLRAYRSEKDEALTLL